MTSAQSGVPRDARGPAQEPDHEPADDLVTLTVDDREVSVPPGTLIIRAAERLGVQIPRFCDHPLLEPAGACRQCIVEVEGAPKPVTSCTTPVTQDMQVRTQFTSEMADKAQRGVMELLLINHPLDCPVCDKGGECPLQNQALSSGHGRSRFTEVKRTFPKPIAISSQVLLDRERCVMCARCTRFSEQIAGDPFIDLFERGARQQVGVYGDEPFESYFSGNTVQICPVGALTGAQYRFRARPFDLVSSPAVCEHCASGCGQRTDHRRGKVLRRLAGDDPEVNEEWNCDKGRWAFTYATQRDRITTPMVRGEGGGLVPVPWSTALATAAQGLAAARGRAGVLTGGRLTAEDAYAYAKFARTVLGTNDVDFRARRHSAEEADFLADRVARRGPGGESEQGSNGPGQSGGPGQDGGAVTYADFETAPAVLLVGFDPEEESPIVFLRLRRAARDHGLKVFSIAPFATPAIRKTRGALLPTVPGAEPEVLNALAVVPSDPVGADPCGAAPAGEPTANAAGHDPATDPTRGALPTLLREPGAVILAGERLGAIPGGLTAACALADATGARLAWIPRRAGERGALETGCLPGLLPGGAPVTDDDARRTLAELWRCDDLPATPGRSTAEQLAAAGSGELGALLIGGVEAADLPDPQAALAAIDAAGFVVSLELRRSEITDRADVVLPVAAVAEKAGMFVNWEGRTRPFAAALTGTDALPDHRILNALAEETGAWFGLADVESVRREMQTVGHALRPASAYADLQPHPGRASRTDRSAGETPSPGAAAGSPASAGAAAGSGASARAAAGPEPGAGQAVLATWRMLLDDGRMQDGEPHLAGTARRPVARLSPTTARELGAVDGDPVTVSTDRGAITLPLAVTEMPDRVVWVPQNSPGSAVGPTLGAAAGDLVGIAAAHAAADPSADAGEVTA
ncbi:NADH dehydrogenase subunit G [Dietzia kunjamensis subsp. schimae]|uniref:NADH-quinone oxidoreductase n=1 Tax=Dietzia kunjamensis subsp. schimae TaxID=498198 RepID=A0ABY1MZ25_9ACTN|nr:NADH-quinone oxidoreductase subunit G [Dietzia kunjamensis]SMO56784.1 NADH dehydrogenase subunit G [Dietzia kunjamensis subsp. schimae]